MTLAPAAVAVLAQQPEVQLGPLVMLLAIGAAAGAITAVLGLVAMLRRLFRPVRGFLADWRGVDPRPGFGGRPGVPERLTAMEGRIGWLSGQMGGVSDRLAAVEAELRPNAGHSLRDQVDRIGRATGAEG